MMPSSRLVGYVTLLVLAACSDSGNGAGGGTIVIAMPNAWAPGPPPVAGDAFARSVSDQIYERLAEIGPDLNTVGDAGYTPRLAKHWIWSKDSLSISFELDPEARWHDGRPVRATDVRFSFDVSKDVTTGSFIAPLLTNIDSISIRDSMTAVAWFHRRTPEQFYDLTYQLFIMPEHIWKTVPRDQLATAPAARAPVGSGRFRFSRFEPGVRVELVADTGHYRGRPKLDRIIWSITTDGGAAVNQLLSGQADMYENVPVDVAARVDSTPSLRTMRYPGLANSILAFNLRDPRRVTAPHPIFGDVRVRRAISMALDRQAMLRNVFDTLGAISKGPQPTALADTALEPPPFDRAWAAALLDSAGWMLAANGVRQKAGRPLSFGLIVPTSSRFRMRYAVLIQEQLKGLGIGVTVESMDFPPYRVRQDKRAFDANIITNSSDPSPGGVRQTWSTAGIGGGGQNLISYSNPVFDRLLDSALTTFDPARRHGYLRRANQTLIDDAPAVWLYDVLFLAGMHRRIRPASMRADGWWVGLPDWWIPAGERIERDRIGLQSPQP